MCSHLILITILWGRCYYYSSFYRWEKLRHTDNTCPTLGWPNHTAVRTLEPEFLTTTLQCPWFIDHPFHQVVPNYLLRHSSNAPSLVGLPQCPRPLLPSSRVPRHHAFIFITGSFPGWVPKISQVVFIFVFPALYSAWHINTEVINSCMCIEPAVYPAQTQVRPPRYCSQTPSTVNSSLSPYPRPPQASSMLKRQSPCWGCHSHNQLIALSLPSRASELLAMHPLIRE